MAGVWLARYAGEGIGRLGVAWAPRIGERGRGGFSRATEAERGRRVWRAGLEALARGCGLGAGGLRPRRLGLLAWRLARGVFPFFLNYHRERKLIIDKPIIFLYRT